MIGDVRILTMAALTVAALSCGTATASAQSGQHDQGTGSSQHATVSVVGSGIATGAPDTAFLSAGVEATKPTATEAADAAAFAAQAMLTAIKGQGVADADITTTGLNLSPVTTWDQTTGPHITGYQAGESFSVKIHDISRTAAVVQAASGAAGDAGRVNGVSFDLGDRTSLRAHARDLAMADAQAIAAQYAQGSGHTLGDLVSLSEGGHGGSMPPPPPLPPGAVGIPAAIVAPIATGQVQESVSVAAEYELN